MSPNKVGTWVRATIGPPSWNLFVQIQRRNKEDFKLFSFRKSPSMADDS